MTELTTNRGRALAALTLIVALTGSALLPATAVLAEGHAGASEGGRGGPGGSGGHDGGHEDGGETHDDTHSGGHEGGYQGGRGEGSQGGGQGAGLGGAGRGGGDGDRGPVWSREGIPEVELGRLNVARSPDRVLDRAYLEALASFSPGMATFYNQSLDAMVEDLSLAWDTVQIIDSPLQNLALLRETLAGGAPLGDRGVSTDPDTLMAVYLGTASDKGIPISADTARAISVILGHPLDAASAASLAAEAEKIRIAILAGHG